MLVLTMTNTDVLQGLTALQHAIQHPEESPRLTPLGSAWETMLLLKHPGYKEWLMWHHQVFIQHRSRD